MDIIKVSNLSKEYVTYSKGGKLKDTLQSFFRREKKVIEAVKNISFTIKEGSITGLLGKNGAGNPRR